MLGFKLRRFSLVMVFGLCGLCLLVFRIPEPYDALILAYMRSGSTFIGNILGHRNDTFYWYEPFWKQHAFEYLSSEDTWCNYGRPGCKRVAEKSMTSANESLQYLLDLYTCTNVNKHFDIFAGTLQGLTELSGPTGAVYQHCETVVCKDCPSPVQCKTCKLDRSKLCFEKMMNRCETSTHRVTKVLRIDTTHAQFLLENHKRLKLVQIVRDPRAVMNSRKHLGWYYTEGRTYSSDAETLCNRMEHDIDSAERLSILFPDRVKIIQYEDFSDPYRLALALYNFLNMEMTSESETLLKKLMKSGGNGKKEFHPDSYRQSLPWNTTQSTNKACLNVFKKLGLRVFENVKEYKDMNVSVILDTIPYTVNRINKG